MGEDQLGVPDPDVGRPIAIVGAGTIGVSWSIVFARGGRLVSLFDPDQGRRRLSKLEISHRLEALSDARLIDESRDVIADRVSVVDALSDSLDGACYVQECASEDLAVKRSLFATLDELAAADAILASSSSAMRASEFASNLPGASRCLVVHPGNPPYLLPLVELVPGPFTHPAVVDRAECLLASVGMSPIRVRREVEGFVFNRLQGAVLREAYRLVEDGVVSPEDVDKVMREGLGRRWSILGPFETAELNTRGGIEAHVRRLGAAYARMASDHPPPGPLSDELVANVSKAVQVRFPRDQWDQHVEWRDRALMLFEGVRRANPLLNGPGEGASGGHLHGEPARGLVTEVDGSLPLGEGDS